MPDYSGEIPQERCGAWGGCSLPKGHNMGVADVPENHAPPGESGLERVGYLCIQDHPRRICRGCTSACCEPVFAYPEESPNGR
jgi:hypothetical protein